MSATRTGVLVIGAGFAGIGMGAALRRQGRDDFIVLERAVEVGGTWRDNTYPGIACDIPSHVYSFSFRPYAAWSRLFPEGAEILSYLRWVAEQEGVLDRIRFGAEVQRMRWDDEAGVWRCSTARGEYIAEALILACGRLSEPKLPPVPGIESFETVPGRALMHSARWRHDVEFAGRRVAIVGSGASAVQLLPELARAAGELTVLQRSAPYVVPRRDRAYSAAERRMFERVPESMARAREQWFWQQERVFAQRALVAEEVEAARELALGHLAAQVADPVLRRRLTPRYEIGCKRVLLSDDYYSAFERQRVALVDSPLAAVEPGVLIARDGTRVEADIAVFATGFQSTRQPYADRVFGEGGRSLAEEWANGMYAYASVAVPGFPNLFVMNGPNAGLGHNSAIPMLETQIGYATQALQHLATHPGERLSVARDRAEEWARMIDEMSAETVWMRGGCESWYKDPESGRLTLLWPGSTMSFRAKASVFFSAASHYAT